MKKFIKENWFKFGILLSVLASCFFIVYYFIVFLPSAERQKTFNLNQKYIEEQKDKCKKAGEIEYKRELEEAKKTNNDFESISFIGSDNPRTPTYFYSSKTRICYYANSQEVIRKYDKELLDIVEYYVKNIDTNSIVLYTEVIFGTNEPRSGLMTLDEFNRQKMILFEI